MENCHDVKVTGDARMAHYYAVNNIPYIVYLNKENESMSFPNGAYCVESPDDIDDEYLERVYRRFRGIPWDITETKRLKVREITIADIPRLYEIYEDESITRYMEPLYPEIEQEIEYTRNYIENVYKFYGYGMWVIVEKESNAVIGRVGLEYREGFEGLELGFMLGVEYQHKGYAYEACEAVLQYGISELGQNKFCAYVDVKNILSINLCVKLGFVENGQEKNRKIFVKMFDKQDSW